MRPSYTFRIAMLAFLAGWIAGLSPAATNSAMVSKLLSDAGKQAYAISVDATLLQSYTRSNLDWRTHAKQINRMKNQINAASKTVSALDAARSQAAPWQVAAIDRILPYLREIAEDTTNAIQYLNNNQSRLNDKDYREYLEANSEMSRELAGLIAQFVDYGKRKGSYEKLREKLEIPQKMSDGNE